MADTPGNVLTGRAVLAVRMEDDALASWSTDDPRTGDYSAKLYKGGTGNDGSTHIQSIPPAGITLAAFAAGVDTNSFYCKNQAINRNWEQFEFMFEYPNSNAWVEFSYVAIGQAETGLGIWEKATLDAADTKIGMQGETEIGTDFSSWALTATLAEHIAVITALDGDACAPEDWILKRVRVELWEAQSTVDLQTAWCLIDAIEIMGTTYTVEPGGTLPAMSLSSPFVDIGYTDDGVVFEAVHETVDIRVDETPYPIDRYISSGSLRVTCNMAESSLANLNTAIAGSVLSGSILTLGTGVLKKMSLLLTGKNPAGKLRSIELPLVTATGTVSMAYKRAEKTIVPVTFEAIKPATGSIFTWVDNAA